ncbi:MAG TPA: phosphoglycerate kinase [Candidatus Paceibacterota bacterium]|nr:phosphoglycerate kinase [Candidatus Paceibacterota bacterium]
MKCVDELSAEQLRGKRVLVRAGLDVPLDSSGEVADLFRVQQASATLKFLSERGARVIVLSHIGRDPGESNAPVGRALQRHVPAVFIPDLVGNIAQEAVAAMKDGDIALLENLRRDPGETNNDEQFAKRLASFGDLYVDDAFSVAHRAHASIVGIPKFLPHYAGFLMCEEVRQLDIARTPESPSFAILGGAKFETKAPLIDALLANYGHVFIAGALANDVFKARGLEVGVSLVSKELPSASVLQHPHFLAPVDVTVERPDKQARVKKPQEVAKDERIVDIGPDSIAEIAPLLSQAKFILWNGPTGLYEGGYVSWTHAIAELIEKAVAGGAKAVIGGGDTIAAIQESGVPEDKLGFLSTGGGAMLEYLLKGTLPGIEALQ